MHCRPLWLVAPLLDSAGPSWVAEGAPCLRTGYLAYLSGDRVLWPELCWNFQASFLCAPASLPESVGICLNMLLKCPPHSLMALLLGIYYKVLLKFSLDCSDFWFSPHLSSKLCGFIFFYFVANMSPPRSLSVSYSILKKALHFCKLRVP